MRYLEKNNCEAVKEPEMEAGDFSYTFDSVIRGHHIFKSVWTPFIGETLSLAIEDGNAEDPYAVAVMKGTTIVGHTPCEISRVFSFFIQHDGTISAEVSGHRRFGCGLEVPCRYKTIITRQDSKC